MWPLRNSPPPPPPPPTTARNAPPTKLVDFLRGCHVVTAQEVDKNILFPENIKYGKQDNIAILFRIKSMSSFSSAFLCVCVWPGVTGLEHFQQQKYIY